MANRKYQSILKLNQNPEFFKFFSIIEMELLKHGEVKVTGLGVFKLKKVQGITRYIPGAKKVGKIKTHVRVKFLPTKTLKDSLQNYNGK